MRPVITPTITEFVLKLLETKRQSSYDKLPLVIGLSGPQGSGKSTVVKAVAEVLREKPYNLNVVEFSLDDVYLTHADQVKLASNGNTLLQHRGLPGTHDIPLCMETLDSLTSQKTTKIPQYDKSAFDGQGDRASLSEFITVQPPFDIMLFEGWCVGFSKLPVQMVEDIWKSSKGPLSKHNLDHVKFVNDKLLDYTQIWNKLDGFVHLDAEHISYVYDWRMQQEHMLIEKKGTGMTDNQVRLFVDGYMPAYELYNDSLRQNPPVHNHLRLIMKKDRQFLQN